MENNSIKFSETEIGKMTNKYSIENYTFTSQRSVKYSIEQIMKLDRETGYKYRALIRNTHNSNSVYFSYNKEENRIKQTIFDPNSNMVKLITYYEYNKYLKIIEQYIEKYI